MKVQISISSSTYNSFVSIFLATIFSYYLIHPACSSHNHPDFLQCLNTSAVSGVLYTPNNSSYSSVLNASLQNLRFDYPSTPKPLLVVTPVRESQIQVVVLCSKEHEVQIRTRSGGHDYEGLSYRATNTLPFAVVDLIKLSEVTIDVARRTAWIGAGATLGQLYFEISKASNTLAFPAGACPSVGVGGHFSGGGAGTLSRKYGLAADNVIDARLIDVHGMILDRESMGEDVFWAIRGGGGASFGVITAWKVNLVYVPKVVTVCSVTRSLEQNATRLFHKWQSVAPNLPKDIHSTVTVQRVGSTTQANVTIQTTFGSLFLGRVNRYVRLLEQRFPEMGVDKDDCKEVSWIQSVLFFAGFPVNESSQRLLTNRAFLLRASFKGNTDYVQAPISDSGLKVMWELLFEKEADFARMNFYAHGGRMNEIPESALPFPHRAGNLYQFEYIVRWDGATWPETSERYINWIRRVYKEVAPYVSMSPRAAYVNTRNLDLGVNNVEGNTSYAQASIWGIKYFKSNFKRLVGAKTIVDPGNFFRNEQSIPPFYSHGSFGWIDGIRVDQ